MAMPSPQFVSQMRRGRTVALFGLIATPEAVRAERVDALGQDFDLRRFFVIGGAEIVVIGLQLGQRVMIAVEQGFELLDCSGQNRHQQNSKQAHVSIAECMIWNACFRGEAGLAGGLADV
jgi:hypothetical protein